MSKGILFEIKLDFQNAFYKLEYSCVPLCTAGIIIDESANTITHHALAYTKRGCLVLVPTKYLIEDALMAIQQENTPKKSSTFEFTGEMKDQILKLSQDLICITDKQGNFKFVNSICEKVLGYTRVELLSMAYLDSIHPEDLKNIKNEFKQFVIGNRAEDLVSRHIHKDGSIKTISWSAALNSKKHLISWLGKDVTELKRAENELRQYESIVSSSSDMIALLDKKFIYRAANKTYLKAFNLSTDKLIGHTVSEVFGDAFFTEVIKPNAELSLTGKEVNYQAWFDYPASGKKYMDITYYPYTDADYKVMGFVVNARDITENKLAEESLKESEEKFRNVIESSPMGIHLYTLLPDGKLVFSGANPAADAILGVDNNQFIGKSIDEAFPPLKKTEIPEKYKMAAFKGDPWRTEQISYADDQIVGAFEVYAFQTAPNKMAAIFLDITTRKQAEEALRQSQAFNETLLNTLPDIIYIYDLIDCKNVYSNMGIINILGYSVEEIQMMGENLIPDLMHPDDFKTYQEEIIPGYQTVKDGELFKHEYWMRHKNGSWRRLLSKESIFMRLDDGTPKQIFGITSDVTERKQTEEEMEKLSTVVKYSSELVNLAGLDGQMLFLNEAGCQMLGIDPENVTDTNIMQVIPDHLTGFVESEILPSLMNSETWEGDLQYRNLKTGKLTDVHAMTFTVKDPSTKKLRFLANVSLDITERKQAEALIHNNLKEKEILLQEVNHRVKNNLAVISSLLSLQSSRIRDEQALTAMAESRNRIKTMALIHEKLYQSDSLTDVDFPSYISDLSQHLFESYNISADKINLKLDIKDIKLEVGKGITCGLIINELVSNALEHAFPEDRKGEIRIKMTRVKNQCRLTVQDNGIGMPEMKKLEGRDSLGLQLIHLFVQQLQGQYEIRRQKGTQFIIQFSV